METINHSKVYAVCTYLQGAWDSIELFYLIEDAQNRVIFLNGSFDGPYVIEEMEVK